MVGQERTVLPLLATEVFGLTGVTRADVPRRVRGHQGARQPRRRRPRRSVRAQAGPRRRLAGRPAGAAAPDLGADVGLGRPRERPARGQPGPDLVDDGDHEDRPRRPGPARPRDGPERGRRVRRRRRHRARDRAASPTVRAAAGAVPPRARLRRRSARRFGALRPGDERPRRASSSADADGAAAKPAWRPSSRARRFRDRSLSAACQAGLVNNLNDGMAWGLLPSSTPRPGCRSARSACWRRSTRRSGRSAQIGTGAWSDRIGRKPLIVAGMLLQGAAIAGDRGRVVVRDVVRRRDGPRTRDGDGLPDAPRRGRRRRRARVARLRDRRVPAVARSRVRDRGVRRRDRRRPCRRAGRDRDRGRADRGLRGSSSSSGCARRAASRATRRPDNETPASA